MQDLFKATPLTQKLNNARKEWLLQYLCDDFNLLKTKLTDWRGIMDRMKKFAMEDFSDRRVKTDPETALRSIFEVQNDTLNVVGGFADFAYATAREDIMGTRPYFAATPEGLEDSEQAELITKHAHWKLGQSNLSESMEEALYMAINLGTAIPKTTWRRVTETSYQNKTVLANSSGVPIKTSDGGYFFAGDEKEFTMMQPEGAKLPSLRSPKDPTVIIPERTSWVETMIEMVDVVFDNAQTDCVTYDKIVADPDAPRLDLLETNVYNEFDMGILDVIAKYGIDPSKKEDILNASTLSQEEDGSSNGQHAESYNPSTNSKIRLVEGYVRVDPFETGNPVRLYIVFDPLNNSLLYADYLANVTPGGQLPLFAVTCYQKPSSWIGVGFHERYERVQEYIDRQFSSVGYRNRMNANPINFLDPDMLEDGDEVQNILTDPGRTYKKKTGARAGEVLEFVTIPDVDARTVEMMNIMMQIAQMRTGISSAAQGELSALPDTNTATGVNSILSRASTLLKWPVSRMSKCLEKMLNYQVVLLYANQNFDETFTWGEGRNAQLLKLDHEAAKNLHYNVKVLLTQSDSREKLEAANAAIGIMGQYSQLPEHDKESQRPLFIKAISSIGFEDAEDIVRQPLAPPSPELGATEEAQ